jgi:hypothetical protein
MKSPVRILLLISSILVLCACGSDDEELPISGLWESTNGGITSYHSFTSQQVLIYTYAEEFECHSSRAFPVRSLTSSTITISNKTTDSYTIVNNVLTIDEDAIFTRATVIPDFVSCFDPTATGTLTIDVEFEYLPESFEIKDYADEPSSSFDLDINFDLSPSESNDTRLFTINAEHFSQGPQDSNTISMNDLSHSTYLYTGGDRYMGLTSAPYTINGNTMTFSFTRSEHKIFKEITNTSSLSILASFKDPDSDQQQDSFPDSGYTQGLVLNDAMDNVGDVSGNYQYQTIVDIKSVTVTITE